jgi:hypothetical protein
VGKDTYNLYIDWVAPEVLLPKGRLAHGTVNKWHCPVALSRSTPHNCYQLLIVRIGGRNSGSGQNLATKNRWDLS